MVRRLCELDYTPLYASGRLPAMVTLTYPGDWLTVVPTGQVLKRHMKALRKRYARAWGEEWACVWKLEFQRRGAPHVHMLCTPPHGRARTTGETFAVWLSAAWADVVDHPDPEQRRRHERAGTALDYAEGLRATDPRRVAAYFTKHGLMASKEYQHHVPPEWSEPGTGPGRFWGVWTLQRAVRTVARHPRGRHPRRPHRPPLGQGPAPRPADLEAPRRPGHRPRPLPPLPLPRPPHDQRQPRLDCCWQRAVMDRSHRTGMFPILQTRGSHRQPGRCSKIHPFSA